MKILFIVPSVGSIADSIASLADELRELGHSAVKAEVKASSGEMLSEMTQEQDIVHVWTPVAKPPVTCGQLVVHLSQKLVDNSHELLEHADAFTSAIALAQARPSLLLWLGADTKLFYPRKRNTELLAQLKIPVNSTVLGYAGDVDEANARAVRSLYLAVAMLNREGVPTTLVRTGKDNCLFLGNDEQWARKYSVELGALSEIEVPRALSLAHVLVQPEAEELSDERSVKLAQLFAVARPVIVSRKLGWCQLEDGIHALVLPRVEAVAILKAVRYLRENEQARQQLGDGAHAFYRQYLDSKASARRLDAFYRSLKGDQFQAMAPTGLPSPTPANKDFTIDKSEPTPAAARLALRRAE